MHDILTNHRLLERFAWSNVMLALDYDGTLAPIVAEPDLAFMRPQTRELLQAVAKLYRTVIVSGRSQADALRRLRGTGVSEVVGNHGVEPWSRSDRFVQLVRGWLAALDGRLADIEGVLVEDKLYSLAVHYRAAPDPAHAREQILAAAATSGLENLRIIGGKMVLNLLPAGAPHKGIAVERERDRFHCDTAIYVGDDETDEDVFALDQPDRLLGIRVGGHGASAAAYCIADQQAIDSLLQSLLAFRSDPKWLARTRAPLR